ncbi:MAG: hypothetical protein L3K09_01585 [Thermoplasmata archaeon]|nr:hypothetical protein [Thermoplasmata archaeon]
MVLSPAAVGARPGTTYLPPYAGTSSSVSQSLSSNCGSAGGHAAHWKSTNGQVIGASKVAIHSCPWWFGQPGASSQHSVIVAIPVHPSLISLYNVSESWSWKVVTAMALSSPSSCHAAINYTSGYDYEDCYWYADWYAYAQSTLWDTSTNTMVSTTYNEWALENYTENYVDNYCYYGTCSSGSGSFSGSSAGNYAAQGTGYDYSYTYLGSGTTTGTASLWTNTSNYYVNNTLTPTHKYALITTWVFEAYAYFYAYQYAFDGTNYYYNSYAAPGPATASASVAALPSSGTSGGITVTSVVLTAV